MFATTPYVIRAVRLVVAYNRKCRLKYARFVKRNHALGFGAVACIGLTIRAGIFFGTDPAHYSRGQPNTQLEACQSGPLLQRRTRLQNTCRRRSHASIGVSDMRECFYWDVIILVGAILLLRGPPMSCLAIRISRAAGEGWQPLLLPPREKEKTKRRTRSNNCKPSCWRCTFPLISFISRLNCSYSLLCSDMRECFYWDDIILVGVMILSSGPPMSCLAIRISRVNDAFKIREELCFVFIGCSCCAAVLWVIQVLVELDLLSDTSALHVVVQVQALLIGMNIGISGLLLPMVRTHRGGVKAWFRATVVPVDETVAVSALDVDGVVGLASSVGEMAEQFGKFCRENLCMESWDLLVDVVRYERMVPSPSNIFCRVGFDTRWSCLWNFSHPNGLTWFVRFADRENPEDEQLKCFLHILNHYLLPTSPDEINISSAMHKRIAPFRTREAFNKLSLEERVSIFKEPFDEIVRVLEQNLLNKFQKRIALDRGAFICD
ncbi:unnamed protein product [Ectocarpus sp. CCAP 1310/34]|nr:unnamed protein product [Ectocarpus sp. CCAP 1310/34]